MFWKRKNNYNWKLTQKWWICLNMTFCSELPVSQIKETNILSYRAPVSCQKEMSQLVKKRQSVCQQNKTLGRISCIDSLIRYLHWHDSPLQYAKYFYFILQQTNKVGKGGITIILILQIKKLRLRGWYYQGSSIDSWETGFKEVKKKSLDSWENSSVSVMKKSWGERGRLWDEKMLC